MRRDADITNTIQSHADTVMRVCSLYFHGCSERDDAFQETFIKYAQSDTEFSDNEHLKAWLITVASNTCKDMLKRADAKITSLNEFDDAVESCQSAGSEGESDRAEELNAALQQLDERYRIALYLMYYEGYSAAEIAAITNTPVNTVYTNLSRGRKELKEVLTHADSR